MFTIPDNIETLFKVEPPLTELKNGFGFEGVLLSDKTTGFLQCHVCGNYYNSLASHVFVAHKIKSKEYKIKFQLPLSFPLVSKSLSESLRKRSQNNHWKENLPKYIGTKYKGKYSNNTKYGRNNASFHNKNGLCELQMEKRYLLVADMIGKDPTEKELEQHDSKLLWAIKNKYGNTGKFKDKYGFKKYQFKTKDGVLKLKETSNPYSIFNDLTKQEQDGIIKTYGSVSRAIAYVGG